MPRPTSGLRRRRTALLAIAVWILMTGGAESDVVEGANDLRGSTSSQEPVPPLEGSSTAELQVAGTPRNRVLGASGAASGLGSKLNISPLTYFMSLRSTQEQCPLSALICPGTYENAQEEVAKAKKDAAKAKEEAARDKNEAKREAAAALADAKKDAAKAKEEMAKAQKEAARAKEELAAASKKNAAGPTKSKEECDGKWGFPQPGSADWKAGAYSRDIAIGFAGNSKRSEQYQISPPGCPAKCKARPSEVTAFKALRDSSCPASKTNVAHVIVTAGGKHTCALTESGEAVAWGSDLYKQAARGVAKLNELTEGGSPIKFSQISAGFYHNCAITKQKEEAKCWGLDNYGRVSGAPKGVKFIQISAGSSHSCGITKETAEANCWGGDKYWDAEKKLYIWSKQVSGAAQYKGTKFSRISAGSYHNCAITEQTAEVKCWGRDDYKQVSGAAQYKGVKFSQISAGQFHTCAITKQTEEVKCWGRDHPDYKEVSGAAQYKGVKFKSIGAGTQHNCAITKQTEEVKCWGWDGYQQAARGAAKLKGIKFSQISAGYSHTCATTKETGKVECWGHDNLKQCDVPRKTIKWTEEASCLTTHPVVSGPASCTACDPDPGGCNRHFTIVGPKTNTGTCTRKECPFCKPKACCGAGHKHYVLNTENLEGVCVRHNDDCTPVCVPQGSDDPTVKRVCTKGCNRLLKVLKNNTARTESEMFDLVVCQADKQVACDPSEASGSVNQTSANTCRVKAQFVAQAVCTFSPELWNLGGTCIKNHVHGEKHPQCADDADKKLICSLRNELGYAVGAACTSTKAPTKAKVNCRKATDADAKFCTRLSVVY